MSGLLGVGRAGLDFQATADDGDALACTFAEPVQPRELPGYLDPSNYGNDSYDRYAEID